MLATIDFETKSECDLRECGAWVYSRHPSTRVMCMAYHLPGYDDVELWHVGYDQYSIPESPPPEDLFAFIRDGGLVEAHNAFFERAIWRNVMVPHGWPEVPHHAWRCSASRASACSLPRDLEGGAKAMGLAMEKDMAGRRLMLKMSKPRKPRKDETTAWMAREGLTGDYRRFQDHFERENDALWHEEESDLYRLWEYCKQDVRAEMALSGTLPELSARELALWQLDQKMNERGARFDRALAEAALKMAEEWREKLNRELFGMTGIRRASMRQQVRDWLKDNEDLDLPDTAADTLEKHLGSDLLGDRARRILQIVRDVNRTSVRKYSSALLRSDPQDWRARDILMYHGAGTGRWTGRGIQVQNFPRGKAGPNASRVDPKTGSQSHYFDMDLAARDVLAGDIDYLELAYGDVMELLSSTLRGLITPGDGRELVVADYSAIEARCLLWEAGDEDALDVFRSGGDIYCHMAAGIYGHPVNKEDHPEERQLGKQGILGLGYGMGFITFLLTCRGYKISFSRQQVQKIMGNKLDRYGQWVVDHLYPKARDGEKPQEFAARKRQAAKTLQRLEEAGETPKEILHELALMKYTVDVYRSQYPAVPRMWKEQEEAAIKAVHTNGPIKAGKVAWFVEDGFLCCELPSGRLVRYRGPVVKKARTPWGELKEVLHYWTLKPGGKWALTSTYGGKLVENITQAVARDIMADAMLNTTSTPYEPLLTVHDELVCEVPEGKGSVAEFEALMAEVGSWAAGCPIVAEGAMMARYRK